MWGMDGREYTYSYAFDEEVSKRFDKAVIRSNAKEWVFYGLEQGYRFALVGLIVAGGTFVFMRQGLSLGVAVAVAVAIGGVFGGVWATLSSLQSSQEHRDSLKGATWECSITEEAFIHKGADGTATHYPWPTMRLLFQHPDGYLVGTSHGPIAVDRKPLADAGLEEMFLARIPNRGS